MEELEILAGAYGLDFLELKSQYEHVFNTLRLRKKHFKTFKAMAKYILNNFDQTKIKALHFLLAAGIVIPFSSADCERSFSDLNRIKSSERSKTGEDLLRDLMLMYTMNTEEMRNLKKEKLREMSEKLAHKVWNRDGYKRDKYYDNVFIV